MAKTGNRPYKKVVQSIGPGDMEITMLPSEHKAVAIRMNGPCPVCKHPTTFDYPLVAVMGVEPLSVDRLSPVADALGRSAGSVDALGHCLCQSAHDGQPPTEPGCGARWGVHVAWGQP